MKHLLTLLIAVFISFAAVAQSEKSIVIEQSSFRAVQSDALTGVNIDPIGEDSSRRPCARIKVRINRMTKEDINAIEVRIATNNELRKCKTAEYDNGLIIEMTAKPSTRFYINHPEFGESNEVTLDLDPNKEYYMEASLNQTYSIVIDSNVKGAEVYIDDEFKGLTDSANRLTVKDILIGKHTLKLIYSKNSYRQTINVNGNNISFRQNIDIAGSKPQYVVFAVEPKNAIVVIDNQQYVAEDGAVLAVLSNGIYSYSVTARGYKPQSGTFTVAGSKVEKTIQLVSDAARVTLTVADGADIYVNGKRVGSGSWTGNLISGTYIFEARKNGYRTQTLPKTITSTPANQNYSLPACTPIYGSVDIISNPLMADITIDGKSVGRTPLQLDNLLIGEHIVTISKSGYTDFTQKITVVEGKTASLSATMTKQSATSGKTLNIGDFDMVYVEGGTFTMGATSEQGSDAYSDESPIHSVTVSDFYIGKYEVTQAQWRAVMGSNPSYFTGDNLPVEQVSWNDIQKFITKLNTMTGKTFRLPTEAEWEYAARGGDKSKGYKYSGSNTLDNVAWYTNNSSRKTHPVGQKQPNELGLYDMSGNVWEWCQDLYGNYSSSSQTNPTGPSSGSKRVLRGGSCDINAMYCRVSYRLNAYPGTRSYTGGFRLACSSK